MENLQVERHEQRIKETVHQASTTETALFYLKSGTEYQEAYEKIVVSIANYVCNGLDLDDAWLC